MFDDCEGCRTLVKIVGHLISKIGAITIEEDDMTRAATDLAWKIERDPGSNSLKIKPVKRPNDEKES